ncbi:MAG: flavocytochrome c [Betaproteobacteria bacterium]|nr:flavocytochrome c [Betaproteobacteria bacterium]
MTEIDWHREADVIVVGGGLAGYSAACEAAQSGAEVLLLEKQPEIGGSTVLSGGFIAFAGTDLQKAAGIDDSNERLVRDLENAGGHQNDERLLRVYAERQLAAYEWLKAAGVTFKGVELSSAHSVPRAHTTDPRLLMKRVAELAARSGRVQTLLDAPAERLVRAGRGKPVAGVLARLGGKTVAIRARRGVVLAAGGFSRNPEMLKIFAPGQARAVSYGGAGNTGDGIRMAWALGAGLRDMGYIKGTFGFHPNARTEPGRDWTKLAVYRGAIAINKFGRRYVDESLSYKLLGDAVLRQPDTIAYQIFDQGIMDRATDGTPPFDFRSAQRRGLLVEADSLEALADKLELDAATLVATVKRYNGFVAGGKDEDFGRDGLSTHYGKLVKIERPPFYAYPSTSGLIATYCGLTVDPGMRVVDVFDEPIERLYAAGELIGGFHGVAYMTGSSLGKCIIFGRIAGRNAAMAD